MSAGYARIKIYLAKEAILTDSDSTAQVYHDSVSQGYIDLTTSGNYYVYELDNDASTVAIQFQLMTSSKNLGVVAIMYEWRTDSVQVVNGAAGSTKASNWYQNLGLVAEINPVCTVVELGGNDVADSVSVATYKSQMTELITTLKNYGDVILVSYLAWADESMEDDIANYRAAQYELAEENDIEIFDVHRFWESGTWADGQGLLDDDVTPKVHPNDAGHRMIWHYLAQNLGMAG